VTNRHFFVVVTAAHLVATIVAWVSAGSWQVHLAQAAGPERIIYAPSGLLIVSWVATILALPIMLPLAYVTAQLGFVDPINDAIYWVFPVLNSAVVGGIAVLVRRYLKRRAKAEGNAV
jgi:hypothetical protein